MTGSTLLKKALLGGALLTATMGIAPAVASADPVESKPAIVEAALDNPSADWINASCRNGRGLVIVDFGASTMSSTFPCVGTWSIFA